MKSRGTNANDTLPVAETPEDVAVLYSWANLHGAKYRDFSASRREYRAQLRHRVAEQVKEQELQAQAEAEASATAADAAAQQAEYTALSTPEHAADAAREHAFREAAESSRVAGAERIEAERRSEAAAAAAAASKREEQEIVDAKASARRQAERYARSEFRRREEDRELLAVPGEISDPYTPEPNLQQRPLSEVPLREQSRNPDDQPAGGERRVVSNRRPAAAVTRPPAPVEPAHQATAFSVPPLAAPAPQAPASGSRRRLQGYTPDDASGVRQIYRGPEFDELEEYVAAEPAHAPIPNRVKSPLEAEQRYAFGGANAAPRSATGPYDQIDQFRPTSSALDTPYGSRRPAAPDSPIAPATVRAEGWSAPSVSRLEPVADSRLDVNRRSRPAGSNFGSRRDAETGYNPLARLSPLGRPSNQLPSESLLDANRTRRGVADSDAVRGTLGRAAGTAPATTARPLAQPEPTGPAWLYSPQATYTPPRQPTPTQPSVQTSVADTLQQSRERVAARWYALKGVFEQPGQEQQPEQPVRQKETRTPVLAVFSLAGGVGKTCLVATLGRALSSMGEKVLLTDTTSHGLLPFYFGASELRQGTVRTFSPPSGSTDAPIYLVSHAVDQIAARQNDDLAQEQLIEEIMENGKGTHRILLDLNSSTGWIARRMARLSPTILVPVAPDMNSVISLQAVEKFFQGATDVDGKPIQIFYLLNQFDASLPLHLDVREVLRRQLGDRLLPFVIRRTQEVSEALAEGMTVVDYAPDSPVSEDYQNVANWLRSIAAPVTAGFRNVRWSER